MEKFSSCREAVEACNRDRSFSIAHLFSEEKTMDMHVHNFYEIYFSVTGGKQFLIDRELYDIQPGDLFLINQFESHYLTQIDRMVHERIVLNIHPQFLQDISTPRTDLGGCFTLEKQAMGHRVRLTKDEQARFLYYIGKMTVPQEFGSDILVRAAFLELMVLVNRSFLAGRSVLQPAGSYQYNRQLDRILAYINENIHEPLTIERIADDFFLSTSYVCRIFKAHTGTTINRYINARRITIAKSLLTNGMEVNKVCEACGFNDYSNFLKAFTKTVGVSPKKYSQLGTSCP
ncbi:helix-turn-helix transcriptional regulator [Anaerotalea alkaliphila]|uniref:AraC family transcriptional regulator n=1 Tax=Anaerotalea alkaliphila TaxID=2662126 RepID=A0A7X5HVK4_9FIRM|nr:AraC family transcriptional regulator [Anaerotalea alkaliphila]NDL67440.1 AraC family transcriptional regulator [Anaerotalea alkaliphila]